MSFPTADEAMTRLPRVVDLLAARADEHDREGAFPYQGIEEVHAAGLLTLTVAEQYGGAGAGLTETVHLLVALASGDPSVALLAGDTLLAHEAQARDGRWPASAYRGLLVDSRRGPALVGMLPPGGPGAEAGAEVTAQRAPDGWLLAGREHGVPGAEALAWLLVTAASEPVKEGDGNGSALFLLPGDTPGLIVEPGSEQLGLRAAAHQDVHFEEVLLDAAHRLTPPDARDEAARRLAVAAICLGVGRTARAWLVRHVKDLSELDRGALELELIAAEELLSGLAAALDAGRPGAERRARLLAPRVADLSLAVVHRSVALAGPAGLHRTVPLERHLRDAFTTRALLPTGAPLLRAASEGE
ncbi:acyl-CoA dehydrogenase family protein [Streptacidiphilus jiangxiensis]|uniref:Acyl-CoA dehydrogenase n=1 Tax=Streptacidiphilus jiangxiensis TaxID=235985 RepID=A0A1H7UDL4_STRJI|nr:acyl-CoA dehydrogenase family protein [Streptacidiphilus jiangxiensis]SEL94347.1 Acyl-CoA dehydrogenase [Streptacidiphilus jiangxiensis]